MTDKTPRQVITARLLFHCEYGSFVIKNAQNEAVVIGPDDFYDMVDKIEDKWNTKTGTSIEYCLEENS